MDRLLRGTEACLIILYLTTTPGMPNQIYLEEAIEDVVGFCKFHLENTVYPEFDCVYRVDPDSKGMYLTDIRDKIIQV